MEYKHYTFSNEVKSELLEFYKTVKRKKHENPRSDMWKILLPKNETLINELNQMEVANVIDLTDEEVIIPKCDTSQFNENVVGEDLNLEVDKADNLSSNDIINTLKENFNLENDLDKKIIRKLLSFNEEQLKEIFIVLSEDLDTESICKFGNGIVRSSTTEYSQVIKQFNENILIPKLFSECNTQISSLFIIFLNSFPNIVCLVFANKLQEIESCTKFIQENLVELDHLHKQMLLREFVLKATKLDKHHFPIIDCLLSNEIDIESIQKLIELFMVISGLYGNDKIFGRLILNLIISCKNRIAQFEQQLAHIISLHRSVWKNKLTKALSECIENNISLSQSVRF